MLFAVWQPTINTLACRIHIFNLQMIFSTLTILASKKTSLPLLCSICKMKAITLLSLFYMMKPMSNGKKEKSVLWR